MYTASDLIATLDLEQVKRLFKESIKGRNTMLLYYTMDSLKSYCPNAIPEMLFKLFKDGLVIDPDTAIAAILSEKLKEYKDVHPCFEELSKRLKTCTVDAEEVECVLWACTGDSSALVKEG